MENKNIYYEKEDVYMKNNYLQGLISGFILTLLISSICKVTFYGLEYGVASAIHVLSVNILFITISIFIVFLLKKLKIFNKIMLISNILLIIFGILTIINIFYGKISEFITTDFLIAGPTVKIPSVIWFIVILCAMISSIGMCEKNKRTLLKFGIGELAAIVLFGIIDMILNNISIIKCTIHTNNLINSIIQVLCGVLITGYSVYETNKQLKKCK